MVTTSWDTTTGREIFKTLVKKTYDNTLAKYDFQSKKLFKMNKTSDLFERYLRIASFQPGTSVVEGGKIPVYDPKFGGTKDIEQTEYGQGFRVSWKFKKTNKLDLVAKWTRQLTNLQMYVKDTTMAYIFNNPTGTTYTGFDGLALASASHTLLDDAVTTYSNYGNAALSMTALESAEYYFDTMKNDQGIQMPVPSKGLLLYYHPALHFTVSEILRSSVGKPFESSNTFNYWEGRFEPYKYNRLTSTTAWGIANPKDEDYGILCNTLAEPYVWSEDGTGGSVDTLVLGHQCFGIGITDPRMVFVGHA